MATSEGFLRVVGEHYDEIKTKLKINAQTIKMPFDEDVFHDTIIKCSEIYKDDVNDYKKVKGYLWVSYKINILNKTQRTRHMENIDELVDFDIIDEEYVSEMDEFYDLVKEELMKVFDEKIVNLWFEHVCNGKQYDEIEGVNNVHYQFKKIRTYIRNEIAVNNERFIELAKILEKKV